MPDPAQPTKIKLYQSFPLTIGFWGQNEVPYTLDLYLQYYVQNRSLSSSLGWQCYSDKRPPMIFVFSQTMTNSGD